MKKILCLVIALSVLTGCSVSKRTLYLDIPSESKAPTNRIDVSAYEQKYGEFDGVYLLFERRYEHAGMKDELNLAGPFGSKWTYTMLKRYRYLVFDNEAPLATSFRVPYKPDNLYIRITPTEGPVINFGLDNLEIEKQEDGNEYYTLVYPNITKGTIIEVGYESTINVHPAWAATDLDIPLQFSKPCEQFEFSFAYPNWWKIQVKSIGKDNYVSYYTEDDPDSKKKKLMYKSTNIPAVADEPFSPEFKQMASYLQFMVINLAMGDGKMDRAETWDEHGERFYKNFLKKSDKTKINIPAGTNKYAVTKVKSLEQFVLNMFEIENPLTDMDKIQTIADFVQDEIEIVYKSQDANASKIITKKEGNIYDITALANNLLVEAGFKTEFILVHSAKDGYFDPTYVTADQLYMPAIKMNLNDDVLIIFPYMEYLPVNQIPKQFQGQVALIIRDKNDQEFWTTPVGNKVENSVTENYNLTILDDGHIMLEETQTFRGHEAYITRVLFNELDDEGKDEFINELVSYTDGDIGDINYEILNLEERYSDLVIKLNYGIDNLVTIMPDEILLQTSGLISSITNSGFKFDKEKRINPIEIKFNEARNRNFVINYPKQWQLSNTFEGSTLENIFGTTSTEYINEPGKLVVNQKIKLNQTYQTRDKYPEFLQLYGDNKIFKVPTLVFSLSNL